MGLDSRYTFIGFSGALDKQRFFCLAKTCKKAAYVVQVSQ
jgi:hypothetical protein